jgi:hypothetical protein
MDADLCIRVHLGHKNDIFLEKLVREVRHVIEAARQPLKLYCLLICAMAPPQIFVFYP